jgi:hypothetical protein
MLRWRKDRLTNKPASSHFQALIVTNALLRQLIYLLANKTPMMLSFLPPNPKSAASVPDNQCRK